MASLESRGAPYLFAVFLQEQIAVADAKSVAHGALEACRGIPFAIRVKPELQPLAFLLLRSASASSSDMGSSSRLRSMPRSCDSSPLWEDTGYARDPDYCISTTDIFSSAHSIPPSDTSLPLSLPSMPGHRVMLSLIPNLFAQVLVALIPSSPTSSYQAVRRSIWGMVRVHQSRGRAHGTTFTGLKSCSVRTVFTS